METEQCKLGHLALASLLDIQVGHCYRPWSSCLGELRQESDYYKFRASISYVVSSRPVEAT